ncbi:hypothetical protein Phou_001400 [Phytohabitans houttuyneae]|uniref:Uncharacterized protein n=1 Tax=Phytohabitans houttuyneae TaxID=1076126 RepID=A0A6V8JXF0_9ACTN|nr:hypothetical protein Phou_001400 [Phytohabitans houttuyneae]
MSTSGFARADAPPGAIVTAASKQAATIAMVRRMVPPLRSSGAARGLACARRVSSARKSDRRGPRPAGTGDPTYNGGE